MLYYSTLDVVVNAGETINDVAHELIAGDKITYTVIANSRDMITFAGTRSALHALHVRYNAGDQEEAIFFDGRVTA